MKPVYYSMIGSLALCLTGCTTSSKVQEMIDAAHTDYSSQLESHDKSIEVLKQSSMTGLEKTKSNAQILQEIQDELRKLTRALEAVNANANASKVLSADNTVKLAELQKAVRQNYDQVADTVVRLEEIDKLFEAVMLRHYEMIVESANEAMKSLKAEKEAATNAPVILDKPIEILAPDTSVPPAEVTAPAQ